MSPGSTADPDDKIRRFVYLTRRIKELEGALDPLKREREELQEDLQTIFARRGTQRVTVDGYTLYVERKIYASYPLGREAAILALKESGHEEYVKEDFNHNSVSALIRDLVTPGVDEQDDGTDGSNRLPDEWHQRLGFVEQFKVKAVRS